MGVDYAIWKCVLEENACSLVGIAGVEDSYELNEGVPRAKDFGDDALFKMNPEFPDDMCLLDNVMNVDGFIVASFELRTFLERRRIRNVEYLPVRILDHKGRVASSDYCIVHPIKPQAILDEKKSVARRSAVDPETIVEMDKLVVDATRIDAGTELFRIAGCYDIILVASELVVALDEAKFSGLRWVALDDYPEH